MYNVIKFSEHYTTIILLYFTINDLVQVASQARLFYGSLSSCTNHVIYWCGSNGSSTCHYCVTQLEWSRFNAIPLLNTYRTSLPLYLHPCLTTSTHRYIPFTFRTTDKQENHCVSVTLIDPIHKTTLSNYIVKVFITIIHANNRKLILIEMIVIIAFSYDAVIGLMISNRGII